MDIVKNPAQVQALVQVLATLVEPKKQSLKVSFSNLYFGKLYLDYFWFCQQCEDYFDMAKANGDNCIPFATSFL